MVVNYKDGGRLRCCVISFYNGDIVADEMYVVSVDDVADIVDDEQDEQEDEDA